MGDENQARQLQELGPKQVTNIKMVLDEARRKSPLGTDRKLPAFSQCEIQYTAGDAAELSRAEQKVRRMFHQALQKIVFSKERLNCRRLWY